jgi:LacI family repressor for deo operon, udp, cdd, tsx, nupC, and nupG
LPMLEEVGVPIVLVNNQREGRYVYSVATDNVHGGDMVTSYLLDLGHKRIGYIAGPEGASSSLGRLEGHKRAFQADHMEFTDFLISSGNGCPDGGEKGMRQLLALSPPPTAVFCYNDMTAIGAMSEAKRMGFRIPQDISVVGFDDIAFAAYVDPPLTTVEQRKYEMGQMAMVMVLDILAGVDAVSDITLRGRLMVRGSTGKPG